MPKYGQYCPVAKSLEILGDRWTLLIIRDLLYGTRHFNELERGLPGISRALLSARLRQLQRAGRTLRGPSSPEGGPASEAFFGGTCKAPAPLHWYSGRP